MNTLHIILDAVNYGKLAEMDYLKEIGEDSRVGRLDCGFPDFDRYMGQGHTVSSGLALITGQAPTKDGDLVNRFRWDEPAIPTVKFSSHREIDQDEYIWGSLGDDVEQGYINVPVVYPPEKINGYMIGGVMSVGRFAMPKSLENRLREGYVDTETVDFPLRASDNIPYIIDFDKSELDYDQIKELSETMIVNRTDHAIKLAEDYDSDYMFLWYTGTDRLFHHASMHDDDEAVDDMMQLVDMQLERLIERVEPEHLVIHSDHGFKHNHNAHDRHGFYMLKSPYKWIGKEDQHILDIPPTIFSTLDMTPPEHYEGTSMLWSEQDQEKIEGRLKSMDYL